MPARETPPPIFPTLPAPPREYSQQYMQQLVRRLEDLTRLQNEVRYVNAAGIMITEVPTSSTGLRSGELYSDLGTIKIVP